MSDDATALSGGDPAGASCAVCGATLAPAARFCSQCGQPVGADADPDSHVPPCPRCRQPVRALGFRPFPRQPEGRVDRLPWNAEWDGRCEHCGHRFELTVETDRSPSAPGQTAWPNDHQWRYRRTLTARPGDVMYWRFLDLQQHLAGIDITITEQHGDRPEQVERFTLTLLEVRLLMESLSGPLAPLRAQRDWTHDTT